MPIVSDFLVMTKPLGAACNIACGYCYYLSKKDLFPSGISVMTDKLMESFVAQRFSASAQSNVHFEWHGGEPTLAGLDFFRNVVTLQNRLVPSGRTFSNGLQTNGSLIDDDWGAFLAAARFCVGLSLDGPAHLHDAFRRGVDGEGTHARAVAAWEVLQRHKVFTNVLCVVHEKNAAQPEETYQFFRDLGVKYLQFLPLGNLEPRLFGDFLCRVFDTWMELDVGRRVIQTFDEALRPHMNVPHALCIHRETCGDVLVLEHDGSAYMCDHFVDPDHRLGNLRTTGLEVLARDERVFAFGRAKRDTLPSRCTSCEVLASCNGGCPKDRDESGMNKLCDAYLTFFRHSGPGLERLAAHMKARQPLCAFSARK